MTEITASYLRSLDANPDVQKRQLDEQLYMKLMVKSTLFAAIVGANNLPGAKKTVQQHIYEWERGTRTDLKMIVADQTTFGEGQTYVPGDDNIVAIYVKDKKASILRPGYGVKCTGRAEDNSFLAKDATKNAYVEEMWEVASIIGDGDGFTIKKGAGLAAATERSYGTTSITRGGVGAQRILAGSVLQIMPSLQENSAPGTGDWSEQLFANNLTQIFDIGLVQSDSNRVSQGAGQLYGITQERGEFEWNQKHDSITQALGYILINGIRSAPRNVDRFGKMSGLLETLRFGTGYKQRDNVTPYFTRTGTAGANAEDLVANGNLITAATAFTYQNISNKVGQLLDRGVDPSKMVLVGERQMLEKAYDWIVADAGTNGLTLGYNDFVQVGGGRVQKIRTKQGVIINMMVEQSDTWPRQMVSLLNLSEITPIAMAERVWKQYTLTPEMTAIDGYTRRLIGEWGLKVEGVGHTHVLWEDMTA